MLTGIILSILGAAGSALLGELFRSQRQKRRFSLEQMARELLDKTVDVVVDAVEQTVRKQIKGPLTREHARQLLEGATRRVLERLPRWAQDALRQEGRSLSDTIADAIEAKVLKVHRDLVR